MFDPRARPCRHAEARPVRRRRHAVGRRQKTLSKFKMDGLVSLFPSSSRLLQKAPCPCCVGRFWEKSAFRKQRHPGKATERNQSGARSEPVLEPPFPQQTATWPQPLPPQPPQAQPQQQGQWQPRPRTHQAPQRQLQCHGATQPSRRAQDDGLSSLIRKSPPI